jgi:hypothetical protein
MALLSKIRGAAFLVMLLTAALAPGAPLSADGFCSDYEWCGYCDAGSICFINRNESCTSYPGCSQIDFCDPNGKVCSCYPCEEG